MSGAIRVAHLFEKAEESLADAEVLIDEDRWEDAALRCYHAVFFSLRARLLASGNDEDKPSRSMAIIKAQVQSGNLAPSVLSDITYVMSLNGFELPAVEINPESVKEGLVRAERFYQFSRQDMKQAKGVTQ